MDEPVTTAAQRGGAKTARIPIKILVEAAPALAQARVRELREHQVDMLTVGQYLQPRPGKLQVRRYVSPAAFDALAAQARKLGFKHAACGPLVRSSYHADRQAQAAGLPLSSTTNH